MTLYILEWDNGLAYDDREVTLLGIYRTEDKREDAFQRYFTYPDQFPFGNRMNFNFGKFVRTEIELNTDLIERRN